MFDETILITTNIGVSPNYIEQVIVFGDLSPFTEYTIVVDGTVNGGILLTPVMVVRTTLQASKKIFTEKHPVYNNMTFQ